jgi:hypothetical protein
LFPFFPALRVSEPGRWGIRQFSLVKKKGRDEKDTEGRRTATQKVWPQLVVAIAVFVNAE